MGTILLDEIREPAFLPGITRPDIYCPLMESYPLFEIANLLHEANICHMVDFVKLSMEYRTKFVDLYQSVSTLTESTLWLESSMKYKNIESRVKTRLKRKLRFSQTREITDPDFVNFLTKKGHLNWRPLNY